MSRHNLLNKKCIPCEKNSGIKPMTREEASNYLEEMAGWSLSENGKNITKEYKFADFIGAINFVNLVADIAEMEGHHPDIEINYNKVTLLHTTHAVDGLTENDFILAAKIDAHKL